MSDIQDEQTYSMDPFETCPECIGTGRIECVWCEGTGTRTFCPSEPDKCGGCEEGPCSWCEGTKQEECAECDGTGDRCRHLGVPEGSRCGDCKTILPRGVE